MNRQIKRGFTLIEILIVVVILGILAAIVIPQYTDATADAQRTSTMSQLQTMRGQIELFKVQMPVEYAAWEADPTVDQWDPLVDNDYLQSAPVNPYTGESDVGLAAAADIGWLWREKTLGGGSWMLYAVDAAGAEFVE